MPFQSSVWNSSFNFTLEFQVFQRWAQAFFMVRTLTTWKAKLGGEMTSKSRWWVICNEKPLRGVVRNVEEVYPWTRVLEHELKIKHRAIEPAHHPVVITATHAVYWWCHSPLCNMAEKQFIGIQKNVQIIETNGSSFFPRDKVLLRVYQQITCDWRK